MEEDSYSRRKRNHDYYGSFIYHIILKKKASCPDFSIIKGDPSISPGQPGSVWVDYTKMGYAIKNALKWFEDEFPEIEKFQYVIMPDHIHLILYKKIRTDIHLETYINIFKDKVPEKYYEESRRCLQTNEIFQDRFTDKLLYEKVKLKVWINYLRLNPHRRAMKIQRPDFFRRKRNIEIGGNIYEGYGNFFLLRNPDKFPVHVRRHFTLTELTKYKERAVENANEGAILVSAFISKAELEIRDEALKNGAKIIHIVYKKFGERFKPSGKEFDLCCEGRLLIISMGLPENQEMTYDICSRMNFLAEELSKTY